MHKTPTDSRDTRDLPLVDRLDQDLQVLERGRGQHAMPEVEDVTRLAARAPKDVARALAYQLGRAEEDGRIEVALDAPVMTDSLPAGLEWHAPVERHDVWAGRCNRLEQRRGVRAEVDARHP